jgi:hypothetical protein
LRTRKKEERLRELKLNGLNKYNRGKKNVTVINFCTSRLGENYIILRGGWGEAVFGRIHTVDSAGRRLKNVKFYLLPNAACLCRRQW